MAAVIVVLVILVLVLLFLFSAIKVAREYERGVVFRLGRLLAVKGPGLYLLIPIIDKAVKVDLRTVTLNVPPQEVITRDNVTVKVDAVVYFRVIESDKAIIQVENFLVATSQIAQTTLRSVCGQVDLDHLLSERDQINARLQKIIDEQTAPWGVKVSVVEVKNVELPTNMQRAIARQAEAERERRAKIIAADGELQASEKLAQAGHVIATEPTTLQLRYLQTMNEISAQGATTIIVPLPIDIIEPFVEARIRATSPDGAGPSEPAPVAPPPPLPAEP
ncbi:MAG TPA: slipin family protein [Miltoncostaeaceae bacterium]|nr:slipin family protein [Miltoncostaeaceae bacterium]